MDRLKQTIKEWVKLDEETSAMRQKMKKLNPKMIHTNFMEIVHKEFKDPIMRTDEDYLVKRAHEILQQQYSDMAFAFWIFDKHWKTMTEANKKHVWDYCKVLIILSEKV